jgi:hypothetical protein
MADPTTPILDDEAIDLVPTERARTDAILEAIGRAANDVLLGGPDLADDPVGQQLRRDLARIGGLVVYASMVREPGSVSEQNLSAILKFGRQLRVRLDRV